MDCLDDQLVGVEIYLRVSWWTSECFFQHFLTHLAVPPLPVTLWGKVCETPDVVNIAIRVLCSDLEGLYACLGVENKVEVHTPFAFFAHCSG